MIGLSLEVRCEKSAEFPFGWWPPIWPTILLRATISLLRTFAMTVAMVFRHLTRPNLPISALRGDTWLKENVPLILESEEYKRGGALFIIWDEAEDSGDFSDGSHGNVSAFSIRPEMKPLERRRPGLIRRSSRADLPCRVRYRWRRQ